jgi:hypothetical protein
MDFPPPNYGGGHHNGAMAITKFRPPSVHNCGKLPPFSWITFLFGGKLSPQRTRSIQPHCDVRGLTNPLQEKCLKLLKRFPQVIAAS